MSFCPSPGCPLNAVTVTPETTGLDLIVSFFASTHQRDAVFTPLQLTEVYNEILFMVKKYQDAKDAAEGQGGADPVDIGLKNINITDQKFAEPMVKENTQWFNGFKTNNTAANSSTADSYGDCAYTTNVSMGSHYSDNGMTQEPPQSSASPIQSITSNFASSNPAPSYSSSSSLALNNPFLNISFEEIFNKTGFIALKKVESLEKLARCVDKPLGCCYDEVRKIWAIADSGNNRVVIYPEGITIESPKFMNPATVCVVEPGKILGILSDVCMATYYYEDQSVAIITEGPKLNCRGLVRTPLGYLATIQRTGSSRSIVVYDTSAIGYGKKHSTIEISTDYEANPSFCAMNGNRLVVTDLGKQTLTLVTFSQDEKSATVKKTNPLVWTDKSKEPNGHFEFVSGVQMDRNGWMIVADARGHTLQLFDNNLNFIARIGTNFALPYMSSVCVNNLGQVVIVGRRDNDITLAELVSADSLFPIQKSSAGGQGGGRGGGRGGSTMTFSRGGGASAFSRGGGMNGGSSTRGGFEGYRGGGRGGWNGGNHLNNSSFSGGGSRFN